PHQSPRPLTPLLSSSVDSLLPPGRLRRPPVAVGTPISPTPHRSTRQSSLVLSSLRLCLSSLRPPGDQVQSRQSTSSPPPPVSYSLFRSSSTPPSA
ncbi:hypothetical protein HAX54_023835, partial [Datura stramonium]|nr:hypothetical protein [Datura stramonium]